MLTTSSMERTMRSNSLTNTVTDNYDSDCESEGGLDLSLAESSLLVSTTPEANK